MNHLSIIDNISIKRIGGVRGLYLPALLKSSIRGASTVEPGTLGCFLSHVKAWERIKDSSSSDPQLIIEDDILLDHKQLNKAFLIAKNSESGLTFCNNRLLYSGNHTSDIKEDGAEFLYTQAIIKYKDSTFKAPGGEGYFLTPSYASYLLELVSESGIHGDVDWFLLVSSIDPGLDLTRYSSSPLKRHLLKLRSIYNFRIQDDSRILGQPLVTHTSTSSIRIADNDFDASQNADNLLESDPKIKRETTESEFSNLVNDASSTHDAFYFLQNLKSLLDKRLSDSTFVKKIWIYKQRALAVDVRIKNLDFAFDFIPEYNPYLASITLDFFARTKAGKPFLESLSKYPVINDKCIIGTFSLQSDFLKISTALIDSIVRQINHDSQTPDPKAVSLKIPLESKKPVKKSLGQPINPNYELDHTINNVDTYLEAKRSSDFGINKVVANDICIGCGACTVAANGDIKVQWDDNGMLKLDQSSLKASHADIQKLSRVCPFSNDSLDENQISTDLFKAIDNIKHDGSIGYYGKLLASRVNSDDSLLKESSSGGMTSWLLKKLFELKLIDGVIHVGASSGGASLYEYKISRNLEELNSNKKSIYYPTTLSNVFSEIANELPAKKYALVGIPCYIKAARLLSKEIPSFDNAIAFCIGIVCGHMKSSYFALANAWQIGIHPKDLLKVDFRVKDESKKATDYGFGATHKSGEAKSKQASALLTGNWGYGSFQPEACNFCDDVFAETADIVFGDAWLPEYKKNWRGTNIVVTRNPLLENIIKEAINTNEVWGEELSLQKTIATQEGGLRHRRENLRVRLKNDIQRGNEIPFKRVSGNKKIENIPPSRQALAIYRRQMSWNSTKIFKDALKENNFEIFREEMTKSKIVYNFLHGRYVPAIPKNHIYDIALFGWHNQANLGGCLTFWSLHQFLTAQGLKVVVVWKPGKNSIHVLNKANYEISRDFYTYSQKRSDPNELHELRRSASNFVLASDQLWSGKWFDFMPEYEFLACGDTSVNKISVSTSLGCNGSGLPFDKQQTPIVEYLLRQFKHISVREAAGKRSLAKHNIESTVILDPVFYLTPGEYKPLMDKSDINHRFKLKDNNYMLCYFLDADAKLIGLAQEVLKETGISQDIYMTTMGAKSNDRWDLYPQLRYAKNSNYADLVKAAAGSQFILTDSFHGSCLALIFNKPFICLPSTSRGNSRFDLHRELGLSLNIQNRSKPNIAAASTDIDWDYINRIIENKKQRSMEWLSNAFGLNAKEVRDS